MPFSARGGFLAQAGGAPLWTPAEITTQAWLEATASDLTLSGTNVTNWTNKANGTATTDYSNATSSEQPAWNSGGSYVEFDGVDDYLQADSRFSFAGSDAIMVATVVNIVSYSNYAGGVADKWFQVAGPPGGGSSTHRTYSIAAGVSSTGWNNRYNNGSTTFGNGVTGTKVLVVGAMASGVTYNAATMFLNGSQISRTGGSNPGSTLDTNDDYSYIGGGPAGNVGQFFFSNSRIHELVCLEDTSTTNRQLIEGYMAWKHGLEGDLPSGHPYKTAAPTV